MTLQELLTSNGNIAYSLKRDAIFVGESPWNDADPQDHGLSLSLIADAKG